MLKELVDNNKYIICAGISTLSLLFTSISIISVSRSVNEISKELEPISAWADSQNECITKTFRIDGINTQGMPSKVWSCNGGGQ
ncbi:hypothetical protein [Prochlorococcus marinus]|uniref:hypothetical protein n=1 Tax=Prochlorococcus marinus TaxID=1219 RepID=UPI0022B41A71|nr:hypothetical protein [Prochlorococcus marinus]